MKKCVVLTGIFLAGALSFSAAYAYGTMDADAGSKIFKDKAIQYAIQAAKNPNFDFKAASNKLSENAITLGRIYAQGVLESDITSAACVAEIAELGLESQNFLNKALAGGYKTYGVVNGNFVMLISASAGQIAYLAIDRGGYCLVDKSIHDSYWAGKVIRLGIDGLNVAFS